MKLRYHLVFIFLFFKGISLAQNLTGTWQGSAGGDYCKMVLLQENDSLFGYTYDTGLGYCKANFLGKFSTHSQILTGDNNSFIERTILHTKSVYHLTYSKNGSDEYLRGKVFAKTFGAKLYSFGLPILAHYKKISDIIDDTTKLIAAKMDFYKEKAADIAKKEIAPVAVTDSSLIKTVIPQPDLKTIKESRVSKLAETIETNADSIRLILYDNGDIDGDTVSVFDNGKIIIERLGLTDKPNGFAFAINKNNPLHVIELMANNLGKIPPNTAFMLILAGTKRYELRLSSDFSVNAQVDIKFKTE